jgi:hypothetical protein
MKTVHPQLPFASLCLGAVLCLATLPAVHGEATPGASPTPRPGPAKVRVMARDNNLATTMGGLTSANAPAPVAAGPAKPGPSPAKGAAVAVKESVADLDKWTHTTKKSLTVEMVNLTTQSLEVNVKSTFLAKDEAGKHEVMPEKTVENKVTLEPGKPAQFTTDEVDFIHTAFHYPPAPKNSGGGGGKGGKGPVVLPVPASGHAYFGYKIEVFQGNDLVGWAVSENH